MMDRNVKIAKELVRLARSLVAENGVMDEEFTVGSERTAASSTYTVEDGRTKAEREYRNEQDKRMRKDSKDCYKFMYGLMRKAEQNLFGEATGFADYSVAVSPSVSETGYIEGKEDEYGKVTVSMNTKLEQDGKNVNVCISTSVYCEKQRNGEVFDESVITLKPSTGCQISISGRKIVLKGRDAGSSQDLEHDAYKKLQNGIKNSAYGKKLADKLYSMNTPWIKRLFGIGR